MNNLKRTMGGLLVSAAMIATTTPALAQDGRRGDNGRAERSLERTDSTPLRTQSRQTMRDRRAAGESWRGNRDAGQPRNDNSTWDNRRDDRRPGTVRTGPDRPVDRRTDRPTDRRGDRSASGWDRSGESRWNDDRDNRWNNGRYDRRDNGRDNDGRWGDRRLDDRRWDERRGSASDQWYQNWRQDRRYDYNRYRNDYRERYRLGTYNSPYRNYGYSRFRVGVSINPGYYGSRYWIRDPYYYRLPPVPSYMRWVRYYDDVVLVDLRRGRVVDVIYNFFW